MQEISWDAYSMTLIEKQINDLNQTLLETKEQIEALANEVQGAWQSEAGKMYAERLKDDVDAIDKLTDMYAKLSAGAVRARATYVEGQVEVATALNDVLMKL